MSQSEYEEIQRATKERADIVAKYDLGREEGAKIDPWEDPAFEVYHVTDRFGFIHDTALPKNLDAAEEKATIVIYVYPEQAGREGKDNQMAEDGEKLGQVLP
jgi:hypothetical protein